MNSIARAAIRSSPNSMSFLRRDLRIIGTGLTWNKALCPRTHPHLRPQCDALPVHSPSTDSPRTSVGKAPPERGLERASAIQRAGPELRPHRVECRVQARHTRTGEEVQLLAPDKAAHRHAHETH